MYSIIATPHYVLSDFYHRRVVANGVYAHFVNKLRRILIWIDYDNGALPDFPKEYEVIRLTSTYIRDYDSQDIIDFLIMLVRKILTDRLHKILLETGTRYE